MYPVQVPVCFHLMANSMALLVGAIAMAAAATAAAAEMQKCMEEPYDFWKKNVAQGDRGFFIHAAKTHASFTCAAKGTASNDAVLDPVVQSKISIGVFAQTSVMPCRLFQEQFGMQSMNSSGASSDEKCSSLGAPTECKYPRQDLGQHGYSGTAFKISMVNGKHTTESAEGSGIAYENDQTTGLPNPIDNKVTTAAVHGSTGKMCQLEESDQLLSSSGLVVSGSPLTDMSYKIYVFASEAERQAALADPRNEGLQYARSMKGENGCDVEIVYEFKPQPGGGLWVELSYTPQVSIDDEKERLKMERALTDTTTAYVIPEERTVVVQAGKAALRKAQYLPIRPGCDDGLMTVVKMSSVFICKATGLPVNISSITMSRTHAGGKTVEPISTDPRNGTTFQIDPSNPTDCYYKMDCAGHQHAPDFKLTMDAAAAPESCGSFYWDPLVQAVPGDGQAAQGQGQLSGSRKKSPSPAFVLAALTTARFIRSPAIS